MIAKETGKYFLQNKPNCKLTFVNDSSDKPHEFRVGPKAIEITLAYSRDNDFFVKNLFTQSWTLETRHTDYATNEEKYNINLSGAIDIVEVLNRLSLEKKVVCVSYNDVRS